MFCVSSDGGWCRWFVVCLMVGVLYGLALVKVDVFGVLYGLALVKVDVVGVLYGLALGGGGFGWCVAWLGSW